jgi:hypothetical protein
MFKFSKKSDLMLLIVPLLVALFIFVISLYINFDFSIEYFVLCLSIGSTCLGYYKLLKQREISSRKPSINPKEYKFQHNTMRIYFENTSQHTCRNLEITMLDPKPVNTWQKETLESGDKIVIDTDLEPQRTYKFKIEYEDADNQVKYSEHENIKPKNLLDIHTQEYVDRSVE